MKSYTGEHRSRLAFPRYGFTSKLYCGSPSSFCCCPPPAKPTLLQYSCTITAQYTPPHRPPICMFYTMQYWWWQYREKAKEPVRSIKQLQNSCDEQALVYLSNIKNFASSVVGCMIPWKKTRWFRVESAIFLFTRRVLAFFRVNPAKSFNQPNFLNLGRLFISIVVSSSGKPGETGRGDANKIEKSVSFLFEVSCSQRRSMKSYTESEEAPEEVFLPTVSWAGPSFNKNKRTRRRGGRADKGRYNWRRLNG